MDRCWIHFQLPSLYNGVILCDFHVWLNSYLLSQVITWGDVLPHVSILGEGDATRTEREYETNLTIFDKYIERFC